MLSDDELSALIEVGVESRSIEFKGPGSTSSTDFVAIVARACIALANQRDGGHLVIGVADSDPGGENGGLEASHLQEWLSHDIVVAKINAYADPPLRMKLEEKHLPNGASVVVVEVAEFDQIPILSAKEFSGKIIRGQLYTRSMAKPESSASNTQNELREVLELAAEKQLQAFIRTARRAGIAVGPSGPSEREKFAVERRSFFSEVASPPFTERPHFSVAIHPETYESERLDYEGLRGMVAKSTVRLRGWPFPYVQRDSIYGQRWVAGVEAEMHPEIWGLHQSGQFVSAYPLPLDYGPDRDGFGDRDLGRQYLPVWFPVMYIFEAVAFASRLQKTYAPEENLEVGFAMEGAQGWELIAADSARGGFHRSYRMGSSSWSRTVTIAPDFIDDDLDAAAAGAARDLLLRFGWTGVTNEIIIGMKS
ncbi:hypothetical protein FHX49_000015 [Microbacterium endophyticum]|uniref:Schlafen AlbA-2 domain-containing protein n=1 Tax=Microbacterium endophyticum TaxID=1526412 RepID=A0A7W4V0F4_9MICO|nr:ATP-binding protein [Microbacterium endophyticum]MBB2974474.1 hypothetical protein [Microbacterium endophyticum]NIK36771.1 hypothetical protein [Microbacterium endophyticum]